jgi:hypothetical protein
MPDSAKIRALIWERGHSIAGFARMIGRPPRSMWNLLYGPRPASVAFIRQIARGLGVKVGDISDWAGVDDESAAKDTAA